MRLQRDRAALAGFLCSTACVVGPVSAGPTGAHPARVAVCGAWPRRPGCFGRPVCTRRNSAGSAPDSATRRAQSSTTRSAIAPDAPGWCACNRAVVAIWGGGAGSSVGMAVYPLIMFGLLTH